MRKMNIVLSEDISTLVRNISKNRKISEESVIKKAFALLKINEDVKKNGNTLAVIEYDKEKNSTKIIKRIIGL